MEGERLILKWMVVMMGVIVMFADLDSTNDAEDGNKGIGGG